MSVDKLKAKWAKDDDADIDAAICALIEHRQGRRLLWWMLVVGRVGMQPFANNALNTAFACGELNVGQQILDRIINCNPQGYITMMKENADERSDRDAALAESYAGAEPGEPAADDG